jgi:protein HIRA/HIR1
VEWGEGDEIVGWKREDLLKEVVVVLGKHRDLQRVTVPYAKLLGVLEDADTASSDTAMNVD